MATVYLIRHGQKHTHAGDPELTEIGIQQAIHTGAYLKQFPITRIIASPFKRTLQTAHHIATQLQLDYTPDKRLVERMNWDNPTVTRQQFLQEWITATNNRSYTPKYGESSLTTGQRITACIENEITAEEHLVIVSHGGAILDYLRTTFGDTYLASLRTTYEQGSDYKMTNCAINIVALTTPPQLKLLHFTDHLDSISE